MASFPTYDSTTNINIPKPVLQTGAEHRFDDVKDVVGTMQDVTKSLSDANTAMQKTKDATQRTMALAKNEADGENDPDPSHAGIYLQKAQEIHDNSGQGISDKQEAGLSALEGQRDAYISQLKIDQIFKEKQLAANKVDLSNLVNANIQRLSNPNRTAAEKQQIDSDTMNFINMNVQKGTTTPEEGAAFTKQYALGVIKNNIDSVNSPNIEDYKDVIKGIKDLTLQEQNDAIKMSEHAVKEVKDQNIANTFDYRIELLNGLATGRLNWKNLDVNTIATKDPDMGTAVKSVLDAQSSTVGEYSPDTENQQFQDSTNALFQSMSKEQINDNLIKAIKGKGMTPDKLAIYVNAAADRGKNLLPQGFKDLSPKQISIDSGYNAVAEWNNAHGGKDPQVISDYLEAVHNGTDPMQAVKDSITTRQMKTNPLRSQYTVGQIIINQKTGMAATVIGYNDNGAPLVDTKSGKPKPTSNDKPTNVGPTD